MAVVKVRAGNGEGSVSLRKDGRWMGRYWVVMPDGSKKRQHICSKSRDEVIRKLREEQVMAQRGTPRLRDRYTTGEFIIKWLNEVAKENIRPTTWAYYERYVRKYIVPNIGNIPLTSLKPDHVREMFRALKKDGRSNYTCWKTRNVLSSSLTYAMKMEYVYRNVAQLVDPPEYKPSERTVWDRDQVNQFLEYIKNHRYYPIFALLFHYGMRRGEVLGLRWQDIDFEKNIIRIRQQLIEINHKLAFGEPKTSAGIRDLPLLSNIKDILSKHRMSITKTYKDDLLFHTKRDNPVELRSFLKCFKELAEKAGLPPITIHEIRHTVATILKDMDVSPKDAQVILGHASIATTLAIYTHSSVEKKGEVLSNLATILA